MVMDSGAPTLFAGIPDDKARVLLLALQSLEGALAAVQQPSPRVLGELKDELAEASGHADYTRSDHALTTGQAAKVLGCSSRNVRLLAGRGAIRLLRAGNRGRGNTSYFDAESVRQCADVRRRPHESERQSE